MEQDKASALLGVGGVGVWEVDREQDGQVTVWVRISDPDAAVCPDCQSPAGRVHEWVLTRPRDVPRGRDRVELVWLKRRWKRDNPGGARLTFTEAVGQVSAGMRLTQRLREHAGDLVGELGVPVSTAAGACGLSWPSTHQGFTDRAEPVLAAPMRPVAVLGIDETRRGRPRFTRDPDTDTWVVAADRWHTGFVDISGEQGLLGQVEGRTAEDAAYWLHQAGPAWRQHVQIVVIDLCTIYASAVRRMLPHATLAVDAFHVVQLATTMVGDVRRRVIREKYSRRGRSGDPEYGIKNLLVRNLENLHPDQFAKIIDTLGGDREGQQILLAWIAKEKLRDLIRLRATATTPSPEQIRHHLFTFFTWCADYAHIPELLTLARTIDRWRDPIIAAILTGVSNATSEGLNRVIKLEGRKAYGFRNTTNQRRRLRYATTRAQRRPPTVTTKRSRSATNPQPRPS
ncbi:MAG: ISL3 family transposase [Pseudonocardiaceae bacterium]